MRIPQNLCPPARVRESNSHIHNKPNLLHTHVAVSVFFFGVEVGQKFPCFHCLGPTVAYHFPTRLVCECESVFLLVGWWGVERFNAGCVPSVCREHMEITVGGHARSQSGHRPLKGPPRRCTNSDRYYRLDAQTKTNILQIVLEEGGAGEGWWKGSASRKKASH